MLCGITCLWIQHFVHPWMASLWTKANLCLEHDSIPGLSRVEGSKVFICYMLTQTNLRFVLLFSWWHGIPEGGWHLCELRVPVQQWWMTGVFYLLCSLLVSSSPGHVQLRMYPPSNFVGLTDLAHGGQFWVHEHLVSPNWALSLPDPGACHNLFFKRCIILYYSDVHLLQNSQGLHCGSLLGACHTSQGILSYHCLMCRTP